MNSKNIDVSIVIISWKMKALLQSCLRSIYKYASGVNLEIIVIDNYSQDGTSEMIVNEFPGVILIKNKVNRGVAPARNQGMAIAKGKYVLILDADVELIENTILKLYEFMESILDCGVVGSKLVSTERQLQFSCKRFPNLLSFIFRRLEHFDVIKNSKTLRYHTMQDWDHKEIKEVDYLIGACQFIRAEVIKKIGMYDDKIFYGPEDIDFCLRVWKTGFKVIYYPHTQIVHHEQRITKKNIFSSISLKHFMGILYIYRKYNFKISR
jgi:GT2 family glycosyltransferase